jgi:hypothetical protein
VGVGQDPAPRYHEAAAAAAVLPLALPGQAEVGLSVYAEHLRQPPAGGGGVLKGKLQASDKLYKLDQRVAARGG